MIETLKALNIVWREHHIAPVIEAMCHHGEIKEAFMMLDYMRRNDIEFTKETALPIVALVKKDVDAVDDAVNSGTPSGPIEEDNSAAPICSACVCA